MKNKKLIPIVLLSTLMLSACSSDIMAKPSDYENPLVTNKDSDVLNPDVPNNITSIIEDAMRDNGTLAKEVLDQVLLQIAYSIYGDYDALKANATNATAEYRASHSIFHTKDDEGNRVENAVEEQDRITRVYNKIENRIAEKMYNLISGSYERDGYFYEEDFIWSLKNKGEKVAFNETTDKSKLHNKYLVIPELQPKEVFTYVYDEFDASEHANKLNGLLTRDFYTDYIAKEIIPEIYRELLVEVYLFQDSYNTLGRSYARKVNIVTITQRANDILGANNLINEYIDSYINTANDALTAKADFEIISKAWRGLNTVAAGTIDADDQYSNASYLLKASGQTYKNYNDENEGGFTTKTFDYYTGTSLAGLVDNLSKVKKDPILTDSTIENSFTNTGEYTVAQGVEFKENNIRKEDYTTSGWFLKNGGLTDLDATLRSHLFNIGVANALNNPEYPDRFNEVGEYSISEEEGRYVAKINGRYYLKTTTSQNEEVPGDNMLKDILWFSKESGTYTLVEIEEAVSSSKLAKSDEYSKETEDIANDVAGEIAKNDSYKTLSTRYWLEAASMTYHDTVIYDYFVDNYPELFED